ncbi:HutD family protein [Pseudorhodobacter sp. E13]|uniref:HutD/Ves family protein n=1 Tax=Pseudorhodobacter sp. E13 TaxID=2487931 RepID=UPI000F8D4FB4|nr:HutD family protein [Pseudorhodobacter sp. E13]RUS60117.1 HutD family protein [Pseudorhodobacter sp. E13]
MMQHLTRKDYTEMPWANGGGTTVEMQRVNAASGAMLWRFSMATVAEDGPFSQFPQIERNLTVIDGPGFDLVGKRVLRADPLCPVAFPGDIPLSAQNVTGIATDFNVMTHRSLPKPIVTVVQNDRVTPLSGATLCVFALGKARFSGSDLMHHHLLVNAPEGEVSGAPCVVVQLFTQAR